MPYCTVISQCWTTHDVALIVQRYWQILTIIHFFDFEYWSNKYSVDSC